MLNQQLSQVRGLLCRSEMKLSDAQLIVLRYLRTRLPADRLVWINRELLGYTKADLPSLYDQPKPKQLALSWLHGKNYVLAVPQYRFLNGYWGSLSEDGHLVCMDVPHLSDRSVFCNIGIQQIEIQLEEIDDPQLHMLSMSADELTGAEFYCWSTELVRIHDAVRQKLCDFLEVIMAEPKLQT
jgi:hypothetical protein